MMRKTIAGIFLVAVLMLACQREASNTTPPVSQNGRLVALITDAAASLDGVSKVAITADEFSAHHPKKGWVRVSDIQQTYDLLALKMNEQFALLADADVEAGTYDELRLHVSKVIVANSNGEQEAKLPSGELKIKAGMTITPGETSTVSFDFQVDKSLHKTGKGLYILTPVLDIETKSGAQVNTQVKNDVKISGGIVGTRTRVGMDLAGNVGNDVSVPENAVIEIDGQGKISAATLLAPGSKGKGKVVIGITDAAANLDAISKVEMTVSKVETHSAGEGWITLSEEEFVVDLVDLKQRDVVQLAAEGDVSEASYDQIRLEVVKVLVTDSLGEHEAKLPSNELRIIHAMRVKADTVTAVTLDFQLEASLHQTGDRLYIFAPVLRIDKSEGAIVSVSSEKLLTVSGGQKKETKVSMDEHGAVRGGVQIQPNAKLKWEDGKIKVEI